MAEKLIVEGHLTKAVEETRLSKGSFSGGFPGGISEGFDKSFWIMKVSVHFQGHGLLISLLLIAHKVAVS